ncbi:hypothetical protein G7062_05990 [Erysipelothrix sp. HDW6C]|uniref:hypothetical protein n=1 Tax=Erysipelothrix sp. HDW6C TaxID=2714930 RepID=UPI00140C1A5E|nr:hypothetical protein [Erysipelothrix sp. HDW6C]QIK69869.1 hypothetical protein G7062_05990 [Erysipelothrix sp. HDW6C]
MKKILPILATLLVLVGCSSGSKGTTTVCTADEKVDFMPHEYTFIHDEDLLKQMNVKINIVAPSKDEADAFVKELEGETEDYGFTVERLSDLEFQMLYTLDAEKDAQDIASMISDGRDIKDIKISETIADFEANNFTCK